MIHFIFTHSSCIAIYMQWIQIVGVLLKCQFGAIDVALGPIPFVLPENFIFSINFMLS